MDDIKQFALKEWHIVALFLTLIGGIFKAEIASAISSAILIIEQRRLKGQTVQLLAIDGSWKTVRVIAYHHEIPFYRNGGVVIEHQDGGEYVNETMTFRNWKLQRIRTLQS